MSDEKRAKDGTRRGGARPGAGRRKNAAKSPTAINPVDLAAALEAHPPAEIDSVLSGQAQARRSLDALVKIMVHAGSDSARITAAEEVLDRGYGKPAVEIGGDAALPMLPFMKAPELAPTSTATVRNEARRFATLAVLVLTKIAENSLSETARVQAHKALIKRECGTVGTARMPDEQRDQPVGKKEMAARAAEAAATGRFATPAPPRRQVEAMQ